MIGLFSSRTLVRLLSVLLLNPDRDYYQQELVAIVGGPLRPVQLALGKLTAADIVSKRREGKQVYYQIQRSHPAFTDLRDLFVKTFALGDVLREALAQVQGIEAAFVFGSTAAAEQHAGSDVDLFVVGSVARKTLAGPLHEAEHVLAREVNLNIYDRRRFAESIREEDHFVLDVMSKPKIWVAGDPGVLEHMAG